MVNDWQMPCTSPPQYSSTTTNLACTRTTTPGWKAWPRMNEIINIDKLLPVRITLTPFEAQGCGPRTNDIASDENGYETKHAKVLDYVLF